MDGNKKPAVKPGGAAKSDKPEAIRVLVADDDAPNRLLTEQVLHFFGYHVTAVASGAEALELDRQQRFDAIFLDVHMPDMTGMETTAHIREREQRSGRRRVPIIALTASATVGDQQRCLASGMDDVLTKPYQVPELDRMVRKWCRHG